MCTLSKPQPEGPWAAQTDTVQCNQANEYCPASRAQITERQCRKIRKKCNKSVLICKARQCSVQGSSSARSCALTLRFAAEPACASFFIIFQWCACIVRLVATRVLAGSSSFSDRSLKHLVSASLKLLKSD